MSYKNKTYIVFDADNDMLYYKQMVDWKNSQHIDFNFHNAHDINNLRDGSQEETIKRKLRERLNNTKQMIVLVGNNTRYLYKFVRWEIEVALTMDIPIIAVNLNGNNSEHAQTPPILRDNAFFVSVPYELEKIKHALDNFPSQYHREKKDAPSSLTYTWR